MPRCANDELEEVIRDFPEDVKDRLRQCSTECAILIRQAVVLHNKAVSETIEKKWNLGIIVEELREAEVETVKKGQKAAKAVNILADILGCSISYLNKSAQLYRAFPTKDKLEWLLAQRTVNHKPLTFGHVEQLLRLHSEDGDNSLFHKMLQKTLNEDLSPEQIDREIKTMQALAGQETRNAGRPIAIPRNMEQQFARILEQLDTLTKMMTTVYLNDPYRFSTRIHEMSQSQIVSQKPVIQHLIEETKKKLMILQNQVKALSVDLERTKDFLKQVSQDEENKQIVSTAS